MLGVVGRALCSQHRQTHRYRRRHTVDSNRGYAADVTVGYFKIFPSHKWEKSGRF